MKRELAPEAPYQGKDVDATLRPAELDRGFHEEPGTSTKPEDRAGALLEEIEPQ